MPIRNKVVSNSFSLHAKPKDGENPYFADLDNEMDSVVCDASGATTSEQYVETNVWMLKGSTRQTIKSSGGIVCKIGTYELSSSYAAAGSPTPAVNFRALVTGLGTTSANVKIYVKSGTVFYSPVRVTITPKATIDGADRTSDLVMTINGVKPGPNGEPATVYSLIPSADVITKDKDGVADFDVMTFDIIKRVGTTDTVISTVSQFTTEGLSLFYKKGSGSEVQITTSYMSGYGTSINYHDIESLYDGDEGVITWILRKDGALLDKEGIGSVKDGAKGDPGIPGSTGKMCYITGPYDPQQTYTSNASETVAVEVENNNGVVELYILEATTNVVGGVHIAPSDGRTDIWRHGLNNYNIIRTKYLFADFAKLGSFVVSQDFFLSQYGTLVGFGGAVQVTSSRTVGKVYMKTVDGKQVPYFACGSSASGDKPCYLFFHAKDPMAEDVEGNTGTFTIYGNGDDKGIVKRIYFYASAATSLTVTVTASSEEGYDFGAAGLPDIDSLSADDVDAAYIKDAITVADGGADILVKASGDPDSGDPAAEQSATISVSKGYHFLEIGYFKDGSSSLNSDCATFTFSEAGNKIGGYSEIKFRPMKVVNALTGEEWIGEGKVHVDEQGNVILKNTLFADGIRSNTVDTQEVNGRRIHIEGGKMDVYNDLGTVGLSIGWDSNGDPYLAVAKVDASGVVSQAYKLTYDGVKTASASFTSDKFTSKVFNKTGYSAKNIHNNTGASTYYNYTAAKNTVTGAYSTESPSGGTSSESWATARSRQNNRWFTTNGLSNVLGGSGDSYRIPDGYYIDSEGGYNSSTGVYSRSLFYSSNGSISQVGTVYYKSPSSGVGLWCDADGSNGTQSFNLDRYLTPLDRT